MSSWLRWGGADPRSRRLPPCSPPSHRCSTFHVRGITRLRTTSRPLHSPAWSRSAAAVQGAALAAEREPDVVVFDGSGAAIPPIDVDARILVSGRGHDPLAYLNAYRVLVSDLVVLVGGGDIGAIRAFKRIPVLEAELRLRPISPLEGRRV